MPQLVNLSKYLYSLAKIVLGLLGALLLIVLCTYSIVYLKGGSLFNAHLNLQALIPSPSIAWIYLGTLIVLFIGTSVWLITEICKAVNKARDTKLTTQEKVIDFIGWLFKH